MKNINNAPLISIIVPMYNVEKYISKCIDSIIGQSYGNIEILLIDDGSPDNSGNIADDYYQKDDRIKVVHVENKGVSEARNLGIDNSTGEYIIFVDGDDYLASDYCEYMLDIVRKTNADFVMSRNCFKFPGNEQQIENDKIEILSPEDAATALITLGFIEVGCWNKMFSRNFLIENKLSFLSKFYFGEGLNFIVFAAQLSKGVGVGKRKVYYYRKDNPNSATTVLNVEKYVNGLAALDNIEKESIIKISKFGTALKYHKYIVTFRALNAILITHTENVYRDEYDLYLSVIRRGALSLIKDRISFRTKITIWIYCVNPKFAFNIGRIKRKLLAKED